MTRAEGRRFGLTVGGAFLVLALASWWRGHETAWLVLGAIGGLLAAGGALVPGHLGPLHRGWMGLALVLSKVTTPIAMGFIYFLGVTPTGVIRRLVSRSPLKATTSNSGYWVLRAPGEQRGDLERQF